MRHITRRILVLVAVMLFALPPCTFAITTDSTTVVSLITCAPGRDIYELEGHTALRIRDTQNDYVVNWGLFDFDAPNFVYRFVKGETDYMCGAIPTDIFLSHYMRAGRVVTEQVLALKPEETAKVVSAVQNNLLPQNRVYRYNYVKDNCSTRPLSILSSAIDDSLRLAAPPPSITGVEPTFRSIMRSYHRNYPWYQFGIDLALGSGIDYPLTKIETTFAPDLLMRQMEFAAAGNRPIVARQNILSSGVDVTEPPTPWYLTPLAIFSILFLITFAITKFDLWRRNISRWFDALIFTAFGLTGCVITFLVFISSHEATSPNLLILWLNPFCLFVPALIWVKRCSGFLIWYQIVNFAAICVMIILMPIMNQSLNLAFIPLWACDLLRAWSYIHITKCERKRRNLYRIRYSGYSSYR
ncbi:MAG: DUF4105 domain-containing protein [Paramuribaculum sp.]|nr:DUF4105 domain-containing protein [Paramuribaculum sp.]